MKQIIAAMALISILTGCNGEPAHPVEPEVVVSPEAALPEEEGDPAVESPGNGARSVEESTDDYLFKFAYPSEAGRIDGLASLLDSRLEKIRTDLARGSAEARRQARGDGFPYNKHSYAGTWELAADIPEWLSLSLSFNTYEGGAHGNHGFDSLVWNKPEGRAVEAVELFETAAALDAALGERFCAALNVERARRRGEDVEEDSEGPFDQCVKIEDVTVLVSSSRGRTFDQIGIKVGAYVAGPYAEGMFEFTFPVDAAVQEAVKPQYQASFSACN